MRSIRYHLNQDKNQLKSASLSFERKRERHTHTHKKREGGEREAERDTERERDREENRQRQILIHPYTEIDRQNWRRNTQWLVEFSIMHPKFVAAPYTILRRERKKEME